MESLASFLPERMILVAEGRSYRQISLGTEAEVLFLFFVD